MTSYPLSESDTKTIVNGRAVAQVKPLRAFEFWRIERMTVQSTSSALVPTCKVYKGSEAATNLVDGTFTGTLDTSEVSSLMLQNGEALLAVWENGDEGAQCTFTVQGTREA